MVKYNRQAKVELKNVVHPDMMKDFLQKEGKQMKLYGKITEEEATYMFFYHMRTADGQRQLEKKFKFPHSNMKQVFGSVRSSLVKWADRHIKAGTITERRNIAKEHCKYNEFNDCTLIIDSADFPLVKQDSLKKKSQHHSYKENRHATRFQFIVDQSRIVRHVSGPFFPKNYDAWCLSSINKEITKKFKGGDKMAADNHYRSLAKKWKRISLICKQKGTKKNPLKQSQIDFNCKFATMRAKVELAIAQIKNRWKLLQKPYWKSRKSHFQFVKIACAVHNWRLANVHDSRKTLN
jgi:hypothetical protein